MRIVLYGHVWLSCIAMLLVWECTQLFPEIPQSKAYIYFTGFAVLCVYNLHSLAVLYIRDRVSEFMHWLKKNKWQIGVLTAISFLACIYILVRYVSLYQFGVLSLAVMLWLLYEGYVLKSSYFKQHILQIAPFLKSIILALVWAIITSLLPLLFGGYNYCGHTAVWSFLIMRFLTFWLITILFDYRDAAIDKKNNVSSMPGLLGGNVTAYVWYMIAFSTLAVTVTAQLNAYIVFAKIIQIPVLYFLFRCRNITSFTSSMAFWDGVLILSPLTGLLVTVI